MLGFLLDMLLRVSPDAFKGCQSFSTGEDGHWENGRWISSTQPFDPAKAKETELYGINPAFMAVGLVGKLAKADGVVSKVEIRVVEAIIADLRTSELSREKLISIFCAAKDGPLSFVEVLEQFEQHTRGHENAQYGLVFMLMRVAHAEHRVAPAPSESMLRSACTVFGFDYQRCLDGFYASREDADRTVQAEAERTRLAYEMMGCQAADGDEHLRHCYRQLVRDFHPDTIAGKGLSPEFTRFAEEKFKQIQAAYELLVEQRQ